MNIAQSLERTRCLFPNKPAIIFEQESFSYSELDDMSSRVATALTNFGILPGDRIALFLPNIPSFVVVYLGIQKMGAIAVSINSTLKTEELKFILDDSGAKVLVTTEALRHYVPAEELLQLNLVLIAEGEAKGTDIALSEWITNAEPKAQAVEMAHDDPAVILYTSGTTGFPKGAMLSHGNVVSNVQTCVKVFNLQPDDRILLFLPMFHNFGQNAALNPCFETGATLVLHREFDIELILKSIVNNAVTIFYGVPTIYTLLYDKASAEQIRSVRCYISAAVTLPLEMARKWHEKFGVGINEGYGLTENSLACFNHSLNPNKAGSIGLPLEGVEMKIVDVEGNEVAPGELGEVTIYGPNVMLGYWNRPVETAEVLKEGWFHTGDLGKMDQDGYFFILDRVKDMVNVGGQKVYPSEVENVLYQHLAVVEVAVYGVPDALLSEQVHASVVFKQGSTVTVDEISTFCRKRLAQFKVPSVIEFVDALPKSRTGKILKRILREAKIQANTSELEKQTLPPKRDHAHIPSSPSQTYQMIKNWMVSWLAKKLDINVDSIETNKPFVEYGMTSILAVNLAQDLGQWLERSLEAIIAWNFPTIDAMADYLANQNSLMPTKLSRFVDDKTMQMTKVNLSSDNPPWGEPIAIIGMGCRLPGGANTPEDFWHLLHNGIDTITDIPPSRWDINTYYDPNPDAPGKMYVKAGGFLKDIDQFDPLFFGISPREAISLDPQQRLLLEVCWEALENAGIAPNQLSGSKTGVFVGLFWDDYSALQLYAGDLGQIDGYSILSNLRSLSAGRIAYVLGLHGPAMEIDTACSSSLLATHLACQSLHNQECNLALAGGVSLTLSPTETIGLCRTGALAVDGRCKTFDAKADGFGQGEGCGVIVLKRLSDAIKAGDNILAVIRGSAVNHDGRSNGLTVPNGLAQEALLRQALTNAAVDDEQIQYVETHGTGTSLGDPIEVLALANVLRQGSQVPLIIGSVKTNLGHLKSAAGIASLMKVVLSLQQASIPPNLHFTEPNPHIPWDRLPFTVPTKPTAWTAETKRAGVSSFGMSGTNIHVIVEEAPKTQTMPIVEPEFQLLVLSAKNEERLQAYAKKIIDFLELKSAKISLANLTYTLQVGRNAMEERLAMVVSTFDEVKDKLTRYIQGQTKIDNFYHGNIKTYKNQSELLLEGRAGKEFVRIILEDREITKLAQLWISGVEIDWQLLYPSPKPQRISLPTYPFAKERYWVPTAKPAHQVDQIAKLHPLLESNTSTLAEQKFTTSLTGKEFYLTDHVVAEQKILPGVAIIEMARVAGEFAGEQPVMRLTNIVWAKPIIVFEQPIAINLSLYPSQDQIEFEVSTFDDKKHRQVHAQGQLTYQNMAERDSETIDIEVIQNRCLETWEGANCYQLFQTTGLNYGPSFQTIQVLYRNENEALSRLQLPTKLTGNFNDFVLHPSLMDGALQTVIGLTNQTNSSTLYLPFALGGVERLKPLSETCYAYVRRASSADSSIKKFHLKILDEKGGVLVRLEDFSLRALVPSAETLATVYYQNVWEPSPQPSELLMPTGTVLLFDTDDSRYQRFKENLNSEVILVTPGSNYQVLGPHTYSINPNHPADYHQLLDALGGQNGLPSHIIHLWSQAPYISESTAVAAQLNLCLKSIFHLSQAILELKQVEPIQLLYVYLETKEAPQPLYAALGGFAKTIRLENSKLNYKTVALPTLERVIDIVLAEFQTSDGVETHYEKNQRWVKRLQEFDKPPEEKVPTILKEKGVYLITGGVGGLGLIFADYLAKQFKAKLVLTGRSQLSAEKTAQIQSFNEVGAEVIYWPADISNREEVEILIAQTKSRFGKINGIIHSAGVIKDAWVAKKTPEEIEAVLAPKVYGTIWLDEVTSHEPLDFFVLFSSVAAVMGNAGQCDYAYANSFMDNFALWRERLRVSQQRFGKTLSINWPLWLEGGMQVDEQTEKMLVNTMGMRVLSTETGLGAFSQGLAWDTKPQFMVIQGYRQKLKKVLGLVAPVSKPTASTLAKNVNQSQLLKKLQPDLLTIASAILKVSAKDIDITNDISEYGFDSISFTEFANKINDKYSFSLTPAIFFEYPSVEGFSRFLCEEYQEHLLDYYGDSFETVESPSPAVETETMETVSEVKLRSRFVEPVVGSVKSGFSTPTPIAIIGMSGIMPQSEDLESFWQHLEAGDDLITEVPQERWDWQAYYGDPSTEVNKTKAKWGGFMPTVDQFDPLFFGISPREAELMDPQQRLFLETVWKTIEDAGYKASDLSGTKTGLFVGVATNDYNELLNKNVSEIEAHTATGMDHSILANRISYLLNLLGPSEPINTACSSSLVAIHRAVEAIHSGACEMAIVGGVNVMLTPTLTLSFSKAGMLSEDGRCKTFDGRANGYVRGEGVGAIWLKPLEKAQADGDTIYAVIKSTAENHGGHATSLTAPNPNAQTQLLVSAYENAQFDPSTISYIEAHGTGTSLGDPIEINGIKNAFNELYKKSGKSLPEQPHCGLGSVKTNIGHLETASGIAGVLKVLLSMKHKTLPGLLHFSTLNPYIQLQESPFYLVTETKPWLSLIDASGKKIPRRAGVSSFGYGGANAHIVLEEYEDKLPPQASASNTSNQLLVFSAKNHQRLKAYAQQIIDYLEKQPNILWSSFVYTLQVGREAMEERLAMVASGVNEVVDKLTQYIQGQTEIEACYRGNVKASQSQSDLLLKGKAGEAFLKVVIAEKELRQLAQLWVSGVDIDWQLLYKKIPQRISLPTYPFARERYWIPSTKAKSKVAGGQASLHPLLESNTSTLAEQRFTTSLTGSEFYLTDHVVAEQKTLPGVAIIEMARAAGELASEQPMMRLTNIVWAKPVTVSDRPVPINISLYPNQDQIEFEVSTLDDEKHRQVHAQGKLTYQSTAVKDSETIDIEAIQNRCLETWEGANCYQLFQTTGLNYGPSFQTIQVLYRNENEALSRLQLLAGLKNSFNDFVLHPSLMDGALQTVIGLTNQTNSSTPYLPFALGGVELLKPLSETGYAYVCRASSTDSSVKKFHLKILDEKGEVLVRLDDFSLRTLVPSAETLATVYYQNVWEPSPQPSEPLMPTGTVLLFDTDDSRYQRFKENLNSEVILVTPGSNYQVLGPHTYSINPNHPADYHQLLDALGGQNGLSSHIIHLWSQAPYLSELTALEAQLNLCLKSIFHLSQAILELKPVEPIQLLYVYLETKEASQPLYAALSGFAKTIRLENSKLNYKTVALPTLERVMDIILAEFQISDGVEIRYEKNQRWVKRLQEFDKPSEEKAATVLKEKGVYLITGGAGGLGLIFANYLAKQFKAKLVLTGRSQLSAEKTAKIQLFNEMGAEVVYWPADISNREEVGALIAQTKSRFGEINGIIHSAGVIKDAWVAKKTPEEIEAVLAPKVYGTVWLDEATSHEPLDFFVLFSSVAAVMGNAGQCDYAYANSFMDNFAAMREGQQASQKRFGKTLSILWPLWQSGGMQVDEQIEKMLVNTMGMQALSTETGLEAFSQGLAWETQTQFMVIEGYRQKLKKVLGLLAPVSKPTMSTLAKKVGQSQLLAKLQPDLLKMASAILKVSAKDIDITNDISEYGFDSISFTEFANKINDKYSFSLTPAIFFEYPSVEFFSRFLCEEYEERLLDYYLDGFETVSSSSLTVETETMETVPEVKLRSRFVKPAVGSVKSSSSTPTPVAIIGMSGIMPQSEDLESFWQHLEAGDDLITEVPQERWDWQGALDDNELGVHANKIKWGGFMPAVDQFDPLFFGVSPREAKLMDPQQRLFLETVWKTIEDAGYKASDLSGTETGLFVGVATNDYSELLKENGLDIEAYTPTGTAHSIVANRISYLLNLHGPSEPINTACSSALIAIHRAVETIRRGTCEMAIAGGVNVISTSTVTIAFSKMNVLSEDGCCRVFDKQANGYVRSEGVGAILLKPLSQAQADGDTIYAVIRGTAENHGGHATSLTAPNPNAQTKLLISAYENADIDPNTISYIEAHSTGTNLGDPIEINGIKNAFAELYKKSGKSFPKEPHCGIGSVKTNVGHLEAASGMASIFKVLFAMKHKKLPGLLHFSQLNPYIQLHNSPFYLVTENQTWTPLTDNEGKKIPRRAGVSSFGFGGANAHIVLEEYEQKSRPVASESTQLMVLSAKNNERLEVIAQQLLNFLAKQPDIQLSNLTYTLQVGREAMDERLAMVVENLEEVKNKLTQYVQGQTEIEICYRGNIKSNRAQSQLLIEGEEGKDFVKSLIKNRKLTKLAQLWVLGVEIDWQLIYSSNKPQRISLPTYPFARERYWVPVSKPSRLNREAWQGIAHKQSVMPDLATLSANERAPNKHYAMILTKVRDLLFTVSGFSHIENEDNLIESGIDSISGVELKERLEKTYGVTLSITFLRDYPTLHQIAGYFVRQLPSVAGTSEKEIADFEPQSQPISVSEIDDTEVKLVNEMADFSYRVATELKGRRAKIDGQSYIDYGSCNYLGLDWHPQVMDAVGPALAQWGVHPPWTRALASPQLYQELEMKLAKLVEAPYADVFPTVTLLNMGLMPELIGPEDTVFIDQYAHNCLQKAAALCHERGSHIVVFRHNDVAYLERKMAASSPSKKKLIVVDGIYSLDGTHAPLPELVELGKRYNAWIMVDDSHGFGILGEQPSSEFPYGKRGNGIVKYYGLDYERDGIIYVGQLSKAYSTMGGFVAYAVPKIKTAVYNAFSMIFSGPLPTASLATGIAGLEINEREGDKARAMVLERTRMLIHGLHELGYTIDSPQDSHLIRITLGDQPTSIEFLKKLMVDEKIIVTPAVYPAVEWTNTGFRLMVTALHTEEDIAETLASMKKLANFIKRQNNDN